MQTKSFEADALISALAKISSVQKLGEVSEDHLRPFLKIFSATSVVGLYQRSTAGILAPKPLAYVNQNAEQVDEYLSEFHSIDPIISYWKKESHKDCSIFRLSDARQQGTRQCDKRYDAFLQAAGIGHILVFNIGLSSISTIGPKEHIILGLQRSRELVDFSLEECRSAKLLAPILRQVIRGLSRTEPENEILTLARTFLQLQPETMFAILGTDFVPIDATSRAKNCITYDRLRNANQSIHNELADIAYQMVQQHTVFRDLTGVLPKGVVSFRLLGGRGDFALVELEGETMASNPLVTGQLTARQAEVARLAANGYRNWQIALLLEISENTVVNHLSAVYDRLGVNGRTELAARWMKPSFH